MEIKINKDIRSYSEQMFFGLTLRQLLCCGLSGISAMAAFFFLRGTLGTEMLSWVCVLAAIPGGLLAFLRCNGLPAERILLAAVRTLFFERRKLKTEEGNAYALLLRRRKRT